MSARESVLRNVSLRLRSDLQWHCRTVGGHPRWIARDPLTTRFFYFSEAERRFLESLDGSRNLAEVLRIGQQTLKQSEEACLRFIAALDRSHLLFSDQVGQGRRRFQRWRQTRRRKKMLRPLQLLAIQIPLLDPTSVLDFLMPLSRWIFSRTALAVLIAAGCILVALLVGRWEEVPKGDSVWAALGHGDTIFLVVLCYVMMKSLHELSHGLACRRWGADCHEMGILLLAFTPCLYCDVSDTWKLPSRFQRAAVAAAGVFTEMGLAIAAGFIWLVTVPGVLHSLAFSTMVLGSLSTMLLNANPLLRYDGYYILADLWNVPNLAEQAREALWLPVRRWLTRGRAAVRPLDAPVPLLAVYGGLSLIYRLLILVLVLWGINIMLGMWGLSFLAHVITVLTVVGLLVAWGTAIRRGYWQVRRDPLISKGRLAVLTTMTLVVVVTVLSYPLPREVAAVGLVQRADLEPIYVQRTGFIVDAAGAGTQVDAGDVLLELTYPDDQLQAAEWQGEIAVLMAELEGLRLRSADDPKASASALTLQEILAKRVQQLETLSADIAKLTVRSWRSGQIIPAATRPASEERSRQLGTWSGTPLDMENRGALLDRGTLVGWIGDPRRWRIEAYVSEADVLDFDTGADVRLRLDQEPNREVRGMVVAIEADPVAELPAVLRGDWRLPAGRAVEGAGLPRETMVAVTIDVDQPESRRCVTHDSLASVRIDAPPRSLAERTWKYLQRTVRWYAQHVRGNRRYRGWRCH